MRMRGVREGETCVCVCERERERERGGGAILQSVWRQQGLLDSEREAGRLRACCVAGLNLSPHKPSLAGRRPPPPLATLSLAPALQASTSLCTHTHDDTCDTFPCKQPRSLPNPPLVSKQPSPDEGEDISLDARSSSKASKTNSSPSNLRVAGKRPSPERTPGGVEAVLVALAIGEHRSIHHLQIRGRGVCGGGGGG